MKQTTRALAASALVALALSGCGTVHSAASGPSSPSATTAAPSPTASTATAPVGSDYTITDSSDGVKYDVTLTKVISPAAPADSFFAADPGMHLVGAVFSVTGDTGTASDDANLTATANGSDGQVYQASFDGIAGYTNFSSGDFTVAPGQTEVGEVTFEVPDGVKVAEIQWTPAGGFGTAATSTWTVGNA